MSPRKGESREDYLKRDRERKWVARHHTLDGEGNLRSITEVAAGRDPADAPALGTPISTSTLFDREGNVSAQWVKTKPEQVDPEQVLRVAIDELKRDLPKVPPIPFIVHDMAVREDRLVGYPVGDHHNGMLSWRPETGASYDIDIAERLLNEAFTHLISQSPKCGQALIPFLGDFFHYDSMVPETPKGKNRLDADSRFQKMIRAGIRAARRSVEATAAWHQNVHVIFEPGNHDPYTTVIMAEMFANIYENNPRITIDTTPRPYHYYRWQDVLIGTHHGDQAKPEALPGIMATDVPELWGQTKHRFWWTGHNHTESKRSFRGCKWESFNVLAPTDAWAHGKGYRSTREMNAIVLSSKHGEAARYIFNPSMLEP